MESIVNAEIFETKKKIYFSHLGIKLREAFLMHRSAGLWDRKEGQREWGNVTEHCLVEAARAKIIGELLGLTEKSKEDLIVAAALHDFYKKDEILSARGAEIKGATPAQEIYRSDDEKSQKLKEAGFSQNIIHIVDGAGGFPETSLKVRGILNKERFSEEDITFLAMHYIDAYTRDANWAESVNDIGENDIDRRVVKNIKYEKWEQEMIQFRVPNEPLFFGTNLSNVMAQSCHEIEKRFADRINKQTGLNIEPLRLPEIIDGEIKKEISEIST